MFVYYTGRAHGYMARPNLSISGRANDCLYICHGKQLMKPGDLKNSCLNVYLSPQSKTSITFSAHKNLLDVVWCYSVLIDCLRTVCIVCIALLHSYKKDFVVLLSVRSMAAMHRPPPRW
jgi:hypothetical protein